MLPAVVVIDLEPTPSIEAAAVLVERCSQVVASSGTGGCALQPDPDQEAPWLVSVQWSGATLQSAQIALFRSEASAEPLRRRELSFSSDSPELDRWESVGLLVAALVVSSRAAPPPQSPPPPPPEPEPAPQPVVIATAAASLTGQLGIAGLIGSGLSGGSPQFGVNLMADLDFAAASVRPLLQVSYGYASDEPKLHHAALALGLGVPWRGTDLELEPYATLLGQLVHARASQTGATESASHLRWGGAFGLNAFPRLDSRWSIWLGAEATLLTPRMVFELHNQPAGQLRPLGWRGFLGLRGAL